MATADDIASDYEERDRARALAYRKPEGPAATGFCLGCTDPLPEGMRWCDAWCRDLWELEQRNGGRA